MTEFEDWLLCPRCNDGRITVRRIADDTDDTEMLILECHECHQTKTVLP